MRIQKWLMVGLVAFSAGWANAAFVPPTAEQLSAVANDPAQVEALLKDASVEQAALVVKDAIARIIALGLPPAERDARIAALVKKVFVLLPGQTQALASALGTAVASDASAAFTPAVVSAIQVSTIAAAGPNGASAGAAFGNSYRASAGGTGGGAGASSTKGLAAIPPAPPVGKQYEGLALP